MASPGPAAAVGMDRHVSVSPFDMTTAALAKVNQNSLMPTLTPPGGHHSSPPASPTMAAAAVAVPAAAVAAASAAGGDHGEWSAHGYGDRPFPLFETDETPAAHSRGSDQLPMGSSADRQGNHTDTAAKESCVGPSPAECELRREREAWRREKEQHEREKEELRRQLAALSVYQHSSSSNSSSSAPPPPPQHDYQQQQQPISAASGGEVQECGICFDSPATVMYMPCRHLRLCPQCYADRRSKLQRDLATVRAENARRRQENEDIERQNQTRSKKDKIALVELLDEPEYLCEHCKVKVLFAGSREEVLQWAAQPIT
mmetsp:Transcript_5293/g.14562  ORF Transcript_5293/g.14562 Transcript_5293/m.14562 type:complete len:316 (+) Transcript_5293:2382-3329(+)